MNECLMKEEMVSVANTAEASVIEEWKGQCSIWKVVANLCQIITIKWSEQVQD